MKLFDLYQYVFKSCCYKLISTTDEFWYKRDEVITTFFNFFSIYSQQHLCVVDITSSQCCYIEIKLYKRFNKLKFI